VLLLAGSLAALLAVSGCGAADRPGDTRAAGAGRITVFAAASLTGAFTEVGQRFEAAHPGSSVVFSFGPSSGLAAQIASGAPADVFASASAQTMDRVVSAGQATGPALFARNLLQIAVPPGNPANVRAVADLARPGVKVVLCAEAVPCGATARTMLAAAGVSVTPVSNEADVKATLAKVQLGEADAGVVYVTDVLAAGDKVQGITIPDDVNAATSYPIAVLTDAPNRSLATSFVAFLQSPQGQAELVAAGFQPPGPA
jgi:molybdate transport system substrate-binding protein